MEDISSYIKHYLKQLRPECPTFDSEDSQCQRQGGCVCYKTAEILANIRSIIPEEYRNANIFSYTGKVQDKRIIDVREAHRIRQELWSYMYEGTFPLDKQDMSRSELNLASVLDERFKKGTSLIIHGDQKSIEDNAQVGFSNFKVKREPKGKTLLASCVMIDAIWRRMSSRNIARTYDWISFLRLRQGLKRYDSYVHDALDADWLVIDDICKIEKGNASSWTKETVDDFIVSRSAEGKPTILVFDFDVTKVSLSEVMGTGIAKIVESQNTYKIKV